MKMSNFENQTWRTAAILKIVISPYLNRESSEFDEICYADTHIWPKRRKQQKFRISQTQDGGRTPYWISFSARTRLHIVHIEMKFGVRRYNRTHTKVINDENSNFENQTWRTAAILKIIIAPYLSRESSELYDIRYAYTNFALVTETWQNSEIRKLKMADGCHIESHFLAITPYRHIVPLRWNLEWGGRITRIRKSDDQNA